MSMSEEFLDLFDVIAGAIEIPKIEHIYLPNIETTKRDDFGFVFLADGSVGAFYVGLPNVLTELWQHYPDGKKCDADTLKLIQYFTSSSLALRSIALGAINAVSHHVMSIANYAPHEQKRALVSGDNKVCMIGCFDPLITKFKQQNIEVMVLEKDPSRLDIHEGVELSNNPSDLSTCQEILCTASTLINETLGSLLASSNETASFSLIGPSGSCLPDILFKYGVDSVGGVRFDNAQELESALELGQSWGKTGNKYQIRKDDYPGISTLLSL